MRTRWSARFAATVLLYMSLFTHGADHNARRLVLVASEDFPVTVLSRFDVRRLFLGVPVMAGQQRLLPLNNTTGPLVHQVFLQKVIYMSSQKYKRLLLARVFRQGGERPAFHSNPKELLKALQTRAGAVSYMWADTAKTTPGLKVVQILWQGSIY
ncbi:MAG TPA: hypothetical protein ENI80_07275 [Acidiferrobacteraceae bacterium]|nr:hypothetical protein [Acidiferrobacteraceae bacterium]